MLDFNRAYAKYFGGRRVVKVYYTFSGRCCVFSAVTKIPSSINAAEHVIQEICHVEKVSPTTLRFFDLQTYQGYNSKKPGEFELDELIFSVSRDGTVSVEGWEPKLFRPGKRKLFDRFIGLSQP